MQLEERYAQVILKINIKNTRVYCLHNLLKLPISHKRGMEITCCSMMSHCLF